MMTHQLLWTYILNLIINSFLTFLTIAFLIQLLIFAFRIKSPRLKVILFSIPLIKLAVDPFLYDFQNWALFHQVNPLAAEAGSRVLSMQVCFPTSIKNLYPLITEIRLSLTNDQTFTLADVIALSIHPQIIKAFIITIGLVSFTLLGAFTLQLTHSWKSLVSIVQNSKPCKRRLQNQLLLLQVKQAKCQLIHSEDLHVPCTFGIFRKSICFPTRLLNALTQKEFEAIIAHEFHHLQWYDGLFRVLYYFICTLFWWVPTGLWRLRLENHQEIACDDKISQFNMKRLDLASAIIKATKFAKGTPIPMLSAYFVKENLILKRLESLVKEPSIKRNLFGWLQVFLVGILSVSILLGRFWIF